MAGIFDDFLQVGVYPGPGALCLSFRLRTAWTHSGSIRRGGQLPVHKFEVEPPGAAKVLGCRSSFNTGSESISELPDIRSHSSANFPLQLFHPESTVQV